MPFVCAVCRQRIDDPWDQLEARMEYRRMTNQGRYRVVKVKNICVPCADAEVEAARPTSDPNQAAML